MEEHARQMAVYEARPWPTRLDLLDLVALGERSVEDAPQTAQMKFSNTSGQLRALAGAGLVASRCDGVRVHYWLAGSGATTYVGKCRISPRPV